MAQDLPALRHEPAHDAAAASVEPSEADYEFFCATVMATARGRGFLAEYVRRHRAADTEAVLAALRRIENMVRAAPAAQSLARVQDELRALAAILRDARLDLRSSGGTISTASKVMALLDLLEARIVNMIEPGEASARPVAIAPVPANKNDSKTEPARAHLTVVPPEPMAIAASPSAALLPPLLAGDSTVPFVVIARRPLPEGESKIAPPAAPPEISASVVVEGAPAAIEPWRGKPLKDRFADVMALSEEERIALFT